MKYLCLIYIDEDKLGDESPSECMAYADSLRATGQCLAAEALNFCTPTLPSMRVRNGKVSVSDGPFAETKECLAGIYLLEVSNPEEAAELMSSLPCAPQSRIELRPVWTPRKADNEEKRYGT